MSSGCISLTYPSYRLSTSTPSLLFSHLPPFAFLPQALDLKSETATAIAAPSRALGGTPSIASPLRWVRVPTIGHAPAARGFHSAVASPNGGTNLFVAFGCDEVEAQCFNDAYMLDTTNPNGMRWLRLPVGLARPHPRHMASMWVRSASLIVSGGCTPSSASATRGEKCYADLWALNLDGLIQGGKHLNSSHVTFKEEDPHNIGKFGYEVSGMMKALPAGSSTRKVVEGARPRFRSSRLRAAPPQRHQRDGPPQQRDQRDGRQHDDRFALVALAGHARADDRQRDGHGDRAAASNNE